MIVSYLTDIILNNNELGSYWYYLDDVALYYVISRAYYHNTSVLRALKPYILEKTLHRLKFASLDLLHFSLALSTLLHLDDTHSLKNLIKNGIDKLLSTQDGGTWPRIPYYAGYRPPGEHEVWFGSEALTTALCIESMAKFFLTYQDTL